jgi:hypothetical protein
MNLKHFINAFIIANNRLSLQRVGTLNNMYNFMRCEPSWKIAFSPNDSMVMSFIDGSRKVVKWRY